MHLVPSSLTTTHRTFSVCPFSRPTFSPERGSQIRSSPLALFETCSDDPDTNIDAELFTATQYTES